jgi:hypothetical protein
MGAIAEVAFFMQKLTTAIILTVAIFLCEPAFSQETYRDNRQNIYLENIPPRLVVKLKYFAFINQNKQTEVRDTGRTCGVRMLWESRNFVIPSTIYLSSGGTLAHQFESGNVSNSGDLPDPCNGTDLNQALTWVNVSPGLYAIKGRAACAFTYQHQGQTRCQAASVMYLAGLPAGVPYTIASQRQRMLKSTACGFLRVPNTTRWLNYGLPFQVESDDSGAAFSRSVFFSSTLPTKPDSELPRCVDGQRVLGRSD